MSYGPDTVVRVRTTVPYSTLPLKDPAMEKNTLTADKAENTLLRKVDEVGTTLHETVNRVAEPAHSAVDRVSSGAHGTIDKLTDSASRAATSLSVQARKLTAAPNRALENSRGYVKDRPLQAIAAALVLGLLVGRLSAPRNRLL